MSFQRRLPLSLLALALLAHAWSLSTPWVRAWTPQFDLHTHSGLAVLGQALSADVRPWSALALAHALSAATLLAAWFVPRTAWARGLVTAAVLSHTALLAVPLMGAGLWNTADAWPEGIAVRWIQALAPGQWWVLPGLLSWGIAQMFYTIVLVLRGRDCAQAELQAQWTHRPGAATVASPPSPHDLGLVSASLRPLIVQAHRIRVDIDTPVRPLDDDGHAQLLDLATRLERLPTTDREALRRAGLRPSALQTVLSGATGRGRGWLTELHAIDHGLHRLILSALNPTVIAYR
ncbi:MAG: hypothetical protein K0V04_35205 [Deltaproteobacteria bacterium]|nr:hypothetical protein [Deltaproteobacteria bacterium]